MNMRTNRRRFLGTTAAAAAWATAHGHTKGAEKTVGPNETVRLGLIGCGGEGRAVMHGHLLCPGVRAVAVCDVHADRLAQTRAEFGGEKVAAFSDYRKLLSDGDVDAVIVATNDHWHALATIDACKAGKHVYVEKPLATSIGEGAAVVKAARQTGCVVQIGTQQHSWPHYQEAVQLIQAGRLGEISEVKAWDYDYLYPGFGNPPDGPHPKELDWEFWVGPSPKVPYNPNRYTNHYWWFDYAGAWQLDWGVHHYDIVHWALGVKSPATATASGDFLCFEKTNVEWPDTFSGICQYGPGPVAKKGFLLQYSFRGGCRREQVSHAKCFFGTEASMLLHRGGFEIRAEARGGKQLGEVIESKSNVFQDNVHVQSIRAHAQVFLDAIRSGGKVPADAECGHYASMPGHLLNIAWRVGRKITWDVENERVVNDPEADKLVAKMYRDPWKLDAQRKGE